MNPLTELYTVIKTQTFRLVYGLYTTTKQILPKHYKSPVFLSGDLFFALNICTEDTITPQPIKDLIDVAVVFREVLGIITQHINHA